MSIRASICQILGGESQRSLYSKKNFPRGYMWGGVIPEVQRQNESPPLPTQLLNEQGSSASQMTAAGIMDVIARLPDCERQAADAVIRVHSSKNWRMLPKLLKILKSECPDVWIRLPRRKWPRTMEKKVKIPWYFLNEARTAIHCRIAMGKTIRRSFIRTWIGGKYRSGVYVRSSETEFPSVRKCG